MEQPETIHYIAPLGVGDTVPKDISFKAFHEGEIRDIALSSLYGEGRWVILFFYPGDFTFVCPTELGELAALYEYFQKENIEIVSMSTDTVFSHKMWHETSEMIKKVRFPMGSDHRHELVDAFNVYCEEDGLAYRATIIIDPSGVIRSVEVNDNAIGRCGKEMFRKVKAAKHVNEHPGEVCPASWESGDETLTPGTDLVGKI